MFAAIQRIPPTPDDADLEPAADALRAGDIVAFPDDEGMVLAADGDNRDAVEELSGACEQPPELSLPNIELARRAFPARDALMERVCKLVLPLHAVVALPHDRAPGGLPVKIVAAGVARRVIDLTKTPIVTVRAVGDDGAALLRAGEVARQYRGLPEIILDTGGAIMPRKRTRMMLRQAGLEVTEIGGETAQAVARAFTRRVLFVCYGNINRSAFAEALLKSIMRKEEKAARARGHGYIPAFVAASAGVGASEEAPIPEPMLLAAAHYGCDDLLGAHRARMYVDAAATEYDEIRPLSEKLAEVVRQRSINPGARLIAIKEDIPDPMGKPPQAYEESAAAIRAYLESTLLSEGCNDAGAQ